MVAELKNSVWSLDIQVEEFFQKVEKKKIKKWKIGVKKIKNKPKILYICIIGVLTKTIEEMERKTS